LPSQVQLELAHRDQHRARFGAVGVLGAQPLVKRERLPWSSASDFTPCGSQ
jgi:hypothetical protein